MRFAIFALAAVLYGGEPLRLETVHPQIVQDRLEAVKPELHARREILESLFRDVGCQSLQTQPVPHSKEPNVVCSLGDGAKTIVVGAHYDAAPKSAGAVDDWSGAAMLSSLYQSLATHPRRHRFVFVAFVGEESGFLGSRQYVKQLGKDDRAATAAMVNLECLGIAPPSIWASRADQRLQSAYLAVTNTLRMPFIASNVQDVGDDDSHPFLNAKIPVITVHSVTQQNLHILHTDADNLQAVNRNHYYDAYRVAAVFLAYIDQTLD